MCITFGDPFVSTITTEPAQSWDKYYMGSQKSVVKICKTSQKMCQSIY